LARGVRPTIGGAPVGRFGAPRDRAWSGVNLRAIAAACLGLAGRAEEGRELADSLHRALPNYRIDDLLTTFQFAPDAAELFRKGARRAR